MVVLFKTELANVGAIMHRLQQKNAMQNNLKKLQQEMAALEAVLQEHGSQDSELLPMCRELLGPRSERILAVEQTRQKGK